MEMKILLLCSLAAVQSVAGHTYHLGDCPSVQPLKDFDMSKLLGKWQVMEKTRTSSKCLTYNFIRGKEGGEYMVEQVSVHPILGLASPDRKYHYTGIIKSPYRDTPAKMTVHFPLNPVGGASFVVFATDYEKYAAIYTCQELPFSNRRSVSILSREPNLDRETIEEIHLKINNYGLNPYDLNAIEHKDCPGSGAENIDLNSESGTEVDLETILKENGEDVNFVPGRVEKLSSEFIRMKTT